MYYKSELYSTAKGKTFQCDCSNRIKICFKEYSWEFSVNEFLAFRNKINLIDLPALLFDLSQSADAVWLSHGGAVNRTQLPLCDCIALRELIEGTYFSLHLVSLLHELLGGYAVVEVDYDRSLFVSAS